MPRGVSSALVSGTRPWESPVDELWKANHMPASWSRKEEQRHQISTVMDRWRWHTDELRTAGCHMQESTGCVAVHVNSRASEASDSDRRR